MRFACDPSCDATKTSSYLGQQKVSGEAGRDVFWHLTAGHARQGLKAANE
jgi:hypothetical protein